MGKGAGGNDLVAQHAEGVVVKNTFIEVGNEYFEDDAFDTGVQAIARKRQVSEPAFAFGRQISRTPMLAVHVEETLPGRRGVPGVGEDEVETEPESEAPTIGQETPQWDAGRYANADGLQANEPSPWPPRAMLWSQAVDCPEFVPAAAHQGGVQVPRATMLPQATLVAAAVAAATGPAGPMTAGGGKAAPPEWAEVVTVMMRNLPNRYTQHMLLEEVGNAGFNGAFDFLYLPIDPETNANKGYAFINFVDPAYAWRFKMTYEGTQMNRFNSSKFVSVSPAALQGLEANYAHYSTARCSRGDPAARPLFLREPQQGFMPRGAPSARRGGQRRRNNGRSLVDVAAQKQYGHVPHAHAHQNAGAAEGEPVPRFCPYCGGATQPSYHFCQFCGASQANVGN